MNGVALICLPFAGAGASFFHPWRRVTPDGVELKTVQLPGRERRILDEPYRTVGEAVEGLAPELDQALDGSGPVVLFGHSLGAVLAYELACRFDEDPRYDIVRLFVSGSPNPWTPRQVRATGLPDDEFVQQVARFAGFDHEAMNDPEVREMVLPTLRADVEMHEGYVCGHERGRLSAPITALRGADDDLVDAASVQGWADATRAGFEFVEMPGGHMYLTDAAASILAHAGDAIDRWASSTAAVHPG